MTAMASSQLSNGNHEHATVTSEQSPPRFTAVNGRENPAPPLNSTADVPSATSQANGHHASRDRPAGDVQLNGHIPRDDPVAPQGPSGSSSRDYDGRHMSHPSNESSHKRKRSYSRERQTSPPELVNAHRPSRSPVPNGNGDPNPRPQSTDVNGSARSSSSETEGFIRSLPSRYGQMERGEAAHPNSNVSTWGNPGSHFGSHGQQQHPQPMDSSDAQLAEALQRDVQGPSTTSQHSQSSAPPVNHPQEQAQSQSTTTATEPQGRPKKKRAFSNRTKTGCMTCRRRKKKCDEQHPHCNNCIRGGFPCEGYVTRSAWQKQMKPQTPVPLQSKDRYPETASSYIQDVTAQRTDCRAQSLVHTDSTRRPLSVDDPERANMTQYLVSPNGSSGHSWPKGSWPPSGPSPYVADHTPKPELREGPPRNEMSRSEQTNHDYQLSSAVRDLSHGQHSKPPMSGFQSNLEQRAGRPVPVEVSNYPAAANLALSTMEPQHSHQAHVHYESAGMTEKAKMFAGDIYSPSDPELVHDRERCAEALRRYNNAKDPTSGISPEETTRLLKQIVMPRTDFRPDRPLTSLGPGVVVEAPFKCNYGYNIQLGENVMVSQNCFFADDCTIRIGVHTWIGPNVTILSAMASTGISQRKGSKSGYEGKPVIIEQDCWIGPGATILPGVHLGRGACVEPGAVVTRSMAQYENTSRSSLPKR